MQIKNIGLCENGDLIRVQAEVIWEDVDRPKSLIFVETERKFDRWLRVDPNGFLLACLLPAWRAGERRVRVDGTLCPVLRDGLSTAMSFLHNWYGEIKTIPDVETAQRFKPRPPVDPRAGVFLSCGIDSLATLRLNKLYFSEQHPSSIRGAVLINYLGIGLSEEETAERFRGRKSRANTISQDCGIALVPITTNIRCLEPDMDFWIKQYHGAVLASVASFLSGHLSRVFVASTFDAHHLGPWGSHPLLDPYYSSAHISVEHHGLDMSRYKKTALIVDWEAGLQNIQVCVSRTSRGNNCGKCEKCIRTMTALASLGRLSSCTAFRQDDISPQQLRSLRIQNDYQMACYEEVRPKLEEIGRLDLAEAISELVKQYQN